jgi:surface antigen
MMSFSKVAIGAALIGVVGLGACSPQGMGPRQEVGIVSGALLGGAAGNVIGRGDAASTLAGALLGGIIGGAIGADLDAQEQRLAARAEFQALDTGRPMTWRGERREVRGEVIPGPSFREGRQLCREYTHTIYIGGRPQEGFGTACREPDGSWRIVS